ncbi:MAG TPA: hypothetical protein ENH94_09645 [Phycisphaerales bacterium]|nr:hypothetical protein [Phycisphaerales bacterium]
MKTILAIDLGKRNSVFCKLDTSSLKIEYSTVKTNPERFHDIFADLDSESSIVLFEVGTQAGWLSCQNFLCGPLFSHFPLWQKSS